MNNKKRVIIIVVILVVAIAALILAFALPKKSTDEKTDTPAQTEVVEQDAQENAGEENKTENADPNVITADTPAEEPKEESKEAASEQNAQEPAKETAEAPKSDNMVLYIVADAELSNAETMMKPVMEEFSDKAQIAVKSIEDETMKMMGFALPDELPKLIVIPADGQFAQIPNCSDVEGIKQELSKLK